jgi:hypothetical protein
MRSLETFSRDLRFTPKYDHPRDGTKDIRYSKSRRYESIVGIRLQAMQLHGYADLFHAPKHHMPSHIYRRLSVITSLAPNSVTIV